MTPSPAGTATTCTSHPDRRHDNHAARWWDGEEPDESLDGAKIRLRTLRLSAAPMYRGPKTAELMETLGTVPDRATVLGLGDIPDQYGRRWNGDDGSTPMPPAPDGIRRSPADAGAHKQAVR